MCTSNPYKPLIKIARFYIDFGDEELSYSQKSVTADMPVDCLGIHSLQIHTYISCARGIVKKDFLDMKQGVTLDKWRMGICDKICQKCYTSDRKCQYCNGEGCIFFNVSAGYWIYDYRLKDEVKQENNIVSQYQKRVNLNEIPDISNILNQNNKAKRITQLETEVLELRSQVNHLMYMPGAIGARSAQEHFHSLL